MTRTIHVRDRGRPSIAERARQMLAGLSEEDKALLWELLRWKRPAASDWLEEHGAPRGMASHLTAELDAGAPVQ